MSSYTMGAQVPVGLDEAIPAVTDALAAAGFGVLTTIDLASTLRTKIGAEIPPTVILGACRPHLAHAALELDPQVAAMLPCNVVLTAIDDDHTKVEVFDPAKMTLISPEVAPVADQAARLLAGFIDALAAVRADPAKVD